MRNPQPSAKFEFILTSIWISSPHYPVVFSFVQIYFCFHFSLKLISNVRPSMHYHQGDQPKIVQQVSLRTLRKRTITIFIASPFRNTFFFIVKIEPKQVYYEYRRSYKIIQEEHAGAMWVLLGRRLILFLFFLVRNGPPKHISEDHFMRILKDNDPNIRKDQKCENH